MDLIERTAGSTVTTGFPLYDAHGNNVATLSRAGTGYAVNDRRSYDAWGKVRAQQSGGDPKLRYCANLGHRQDDESGLVYMRARYYEPTSGRFVSEDPAMEGPNWFTYCSDDPVNRVDRTGKWGTPEFVSTFMFGCAVFFLGLTLLGWSSEIRSDTRILRYIDGKNKEMIRFNSPYLDNAMNRLENEANTAKISKGVASSVILQAVGYSFVILGLLIDIDLAPDGEFDILSTFFGGH